MSSEPRRLHPAGMVIDSLQALRGLLGPAAIGFAVTVLNRGLDGSTVVFAGVVAVIAVLVAAVIGVAVWRSTTYDVTGRAVRYRRGILQRTEKSLPLDRIQSVGTVQGPVQRLLGVVELRIEAAGGGRGSEIALGALGADAAADLRARLDPERRPEAGQDGHAEPGRHPRADAARERRLGRRALMTAALTSGQIGVALPLVAAATQFADDLVRAGVDDVDPGILPSGALMLAAIALGVGLVAWLLAITGTVLAFAGFSVARDEDRLRIRRGLLQRHETVIPVARVHAVRMVEGVLRQPFGLASLRVESAGYAGEPGVATTLYPLLARRDVPEFLERILPEHADALGDLERPPGRARPRYLIGPALPVALGAGLATVLAGSTGAAAFALLLPAAAYGALSRRDAGWALREGRLVVRSRLLARTTVIAAADRLDTRSFSQSLLQRRARLADFSFQLGSRAGFAVRHLEADVALGLVARLGHPDAPPTSG
jgi:putative membrane protein